MKVYITRELPEIAEKLLNEKNYDVKVYRVDNPVPKNVLLENVIDCDALIPLLTDQLDKEVIDAMNNCKVIANYAVGYNNIDVGYASSKDIIVTNTPDVLTDATADLTMALVLAVGRKIPQAAEILSSGKYDGWKPKFNLGIELKGKVFGIIGAGRIGTAVAKRASAFGCKIVYYSTSRNNFLEDNFNAEKLPLKELLLTSDIISVHVPLTDETRHLLNYEKLSQLKSTAILVNTARGEIIDETGLIKILKEEKIFAAGLDVFENEPHLNPEFLDLKNLIILPHIGSATFSTRSKMAEVAAKNVISVLETGKPLNPVN